MRVKRIAFNQVPQFSFKDVAYATANPDLRSFFKYPVSLESFRDVIHDKQKAPINRKVLVEALQHQYERRTPSKEVQKNIGALLNDRTFTVVTAHQPALFTGPLYYILKIFSTINLAETLKKEYPEYDFIPVFINGAEDHDFEEINHTFLNGKTLVWNNKEEGAVGKMATKTLSRVLTELKSTLPQGPFSDKCFQLIEKAYTQNDTYGAATHELVHELFKDYGLVVIDMSPHILKKVFIPYMEKELFDQISSLLIHETQEKLESIGFSQQAHAREINLFYLQPNSRSRIVQEEDGTFRILNTELYFTKEELRRELYEYPERFSPNVVMRPLYQEVVLPNLAYIGGGGEIAYWLERKTQFEYFGVNFPMLVRRNSAVWIDQQSTKKIEKLGLSVEELFEETESLIKKFVRRHSENQLDLSPEMTELARLIDQYAEKAHKVDPTLDPRARAIGQKYHNQLEKLQKRLMRAEKKKFEKEITTLRWIKDALFPKNGLQERKHNFLNFYAETGPFFFETLKEHLHPLEEGMVVFWDDGR